MNRAAMSGLARRLASQHGRLGPNLGHGPVLSTPLLPSGGTIKVCSPPVTQGAFGSLARPAAKSRIPIATAASTHLLSQHRVGTLAGSTAGFSTSPNSGDDNGLSVAAERGNFQELRQRVAAQISETKDKVLGFQTRYMNKVRPEVASRLLIVPGKISDPSTVFLHRQTFDIFKKNPSYLSCFDLMLFESVCKDEDEWNRFLDHLVERKKYIIEKWDVSYSTVEVLMYDLGLKQPDDGTKEPFYKGECDASFDPDTGKSNLSYIIWKDDKIVYAEVFTGVNCSSALDAEILAACALLYKAEELKIKKMHLWSDSKTVAKILTGEQPIDLNHPNRDEYLMLRAMRARFKWLVVTWKPRELMVFVDALGKLADVTGTAEVSPDSAKYNLQEWADHLKGVPVFRIERTKATNTAVKNFRKVMLDESHGMNLDSVFFLEVEEDLKFECLSALNNTLEPREMTVFVSNYNEKSDCFKQKFQSYYRMYSEDKPYDVFLSKSTKDGLSSKSLVVSDYAVPKDVYYTSGAFHVVLVTPSEVKTMPKNIPELTALGFVYFNEVRFPLN